MGNNGFMPFEIYRFIRHSDVIIAGNSMLVRQLPNLVRQGLLRSIVIAIALGMITFFGYLTGMTIVQSWEHCTEPEPTVEMQFSTDDLTLVGGLLSALLLTLAVRFGQTRWLRPKETEAINREREDEIAGRKRAEEERPPASPEVEHIAKSVVITEPDELGHRSVWGREGLRPAVRSHKDGE